MAQIRLTKVSNGVLTQLTETTDSARLFSVGLGATAPTDAPAISIGAIPAVSGNIRLPNATTALAFRNAANSSDIPLLSTNSSNQITLGGSSNGGITISTTGNITIPSLGSGLLRSDSSGNLTISTGITNADIAAGASIAGTKISPDFGSQIIQTTGLLRLGPSAGVNALAFGGSWPFVGVDTVFIHNASGNSYYTNWSGGASSAAGFFAYNTSAGSTATVGLAIGGAGSSHSESVLANNGFIEQAGPSTSAIVFRKALGDASNKGTTGKIYQTGAWAIGEANNNDTSSEAQAGITGPLLNISSATGTVTSTAGQTLLYNISGIASLQGHSGVNLVVNTSNAVSITSTSSTITGNLVVSGTSTTLSNMTSGRVVMTSTGGLLVDTVVVPVGNLPSLSGDVTGTITSNTLVTISGASPISITPAILQWATATSTPTLKQADNTSNSATGQPLSIQAQNATGTTSIGGVLNLTSGSGTSTGGDLTLQSGSASTGVGSPGIVGIYTGTGSANGFINLGRGGVAAVTFTALPTGASAWSFGAGVTSVTYTQAAATITNGALTRLSAQSTSLNAGTGGSLVINAGNATGTTGTGGSVAISSGSGTANSFITLCQNNTPAVTFTPLPTGASAWSFASTATSITYTQATTSIASGASTTLSSQSTSGDGYNGGILALSSGNATGTTGNGGAINISAGTGATSSGLINFQRGGVTALYISPIPTGATAISYAATVTSVTLSQTATTTTSGASWAMSAQATSFDGGAGGALTLSAGTSTGATTGTGGNVNINAGAGPTTSGLINFGRAGTSAVYISPNPTGATAISYAIGVTAVTLSQTAATATSGAPWSISAQATSFDGGAGGALNLSAGTSTGATTGTGGAININAGAGTTVGGAINFQRGGSTAVSFAPIATGTAAWTYVTGVTQVLVQQTASTTAIGSPMSFTAQSTSFEGSSGGNLNLNAGSATGVAGSGGNVFINAGTGNTAGGAIVFRRGGSDVLTLTPNPTGNSILQFANTVTGPSISHANATGGNGAFFQISSQPTSNDGSTGGSLSMAAGSATGTTGTGGAIDLRAGTGTTNGMINFRLGATTFAQWRGLTATSATLQWVNTSNPTINQADNTTASATATTFTLQAQNATGTTSNGGALALSVGTGTTANGNIRFDAGGASAIRYQIIPTGATTMSFQSTITSASIQYNSTAIANGGTFSLSSQSVTADGYNAGALNITAGSQSTGGGATTGNGGGITVTSGSTNASTTGNAGNITFAGGSVTGTSTGTGSSISLNAGSSINGLGGSVSLSAGTGTSAGKINFRLASNNALQYTVSDVGANTMSFVAGATSFAMNQSVTTASTNGAAWSIIAQNVGVGDGYTGGSLTLRAGGSSGGTNQIGGNVLIGAGGATTSGTGLSGNIQLAIASTPIITFTLSGTAGSSTGPATMQLATSGTAFNINQADKTTNSGTGAPLTIQAQNETGTTSTGGSLNLTSGTGTSAAGNVNIQCGGTTIAQATSSKFISSKGSRKSVTTITGTYTILTTDENIIVTTNALAFTITMPASPALGDWYAIKDGVGNSAVNNISVAGNGKNIDGSATYIISNNYAAIMLIYNGTEWSVL